MFLPESLPESRAINICRNEQTRFGGDKNADWNQLLISLGPSKYHVPGVRPKSLLDSRKSRVRRFPKRRGDCLEPIYQED